MEIFAEPRNKRQFQRGTKLKFYFDAKAENVCANQIQVQQLLVNLLRNANDAMTKDRYDLEVRTALLNNEMVEIPTAVWDCQLKSPAPFRGISIRKRDGIGLGLTICQSIAEVHGGKLQHEPNPGGGTVFSLYPARYPEK